jgi:hypothetical protein
MNLAGIVTDTNRVQFKIVVEKHADGYVGYLC